MGMFDDLRCEYPLPDGFTGRDFQTKSFDSALEQYVLTADGRLTLDEKDTEYHGIFQFYTAGPDGAWHQHSAKFTDGKLVWLRVCSREDSR